MTQEKQPLGLPDRVVKITGTPDQLLRAVALLLTKLVESPNYTRFTTSNVSYGPPLAPVRPLLPLLNPSSGKGALGCIRVLAAACQQHSIACADLSAGMPYMDSWSVLCTMLLQLMLRVDAWLPACPRKDLL